MNTKADGNDIYIYETSEISDSQKKKKVKYDLVVVLQY